MPGKPKPQDLPPPRFRVMLWREVPVAEKDGELVIERSRETLYVSAPTLGKLFSVMKGESENFFN